MTSPKPRLAARMPAWIAVGLSFLTVGCGAAHMAKPVGPDLPTPEGIFRWSEPAGSVVARIEGVYHYRGIPCHEIWGCEFCFIRLKNVGPTPVRVPTGSPAGVSQPASFTLSVRSAPGDWRKADWSPADSAPPGMPPRTLRLLPGESALVMAGGRFAEEVEGASEIKFAVSLPPGRGGITKAERIETPPYPAHLNTDRWSDLAGRGALDGLAEYRGTVSFPDVFPAFCRNGAKSDSSSIFDDESVFDRLARRNHELLCQLELYDKRGVATEFERRLDNERNDDVRLLYATIAAEASSLKGRRFVLSYRQRTEYEAVRSAMSALKYLACVEHPPEWVVDAVLAALADDREITGKYERGRTSSVFLGGATAGRKISAKERIGWPEDEPCPISYFARDLCTLLAKRKCAKLVPFLMAKVDPKDPATWPLEELIDIGDDHMVPMLKDFLERADPVTGAHPREWTGDIRKIAVALAAFKIKEGALILLPYVGDPSVDGALIQMGDRSIVPALRQIIAEGHKVRWHDDSSEEFAAKSSLDSARVLLAALEPGDPLPRYCSLLADQSLGKFARRDIVWILGDKPDERAIPHLIRAIKTNPAGCVVNQSITVLGMYKYKAAVEGLIDCFDADFTGKEDWHRAYTPEMFRANIATSLRAITGVSIGTNKAAWQYWWNTEGITRTDLK